MDEFNIVASSIFCGAIGGLVVDCVLFPIDTIKTRMQSREGFRETGGFKGIYSGIITQICLSAPTAGLFFCVYDSFKYFLVPEVPAKYSFLIFAIAAAIAEAAACLIRVPMEVIKQRRQIARKKTTISILREAIRTEGLINGLYRGYDSTVLREVPFALIQLPIFESLRTLMEKVLKGGLELESWQIAMCGAFAGGFAAGVTTPMDVIKTRIMIAETKVNSKGPTISKTMKTIHSEKGYRGFCSGLVPRVIWMFLAGFVFFGTFSFANSIYNSYIYNIKQNGTSTLQNVTNSY